MAETNLFSTRENHRTLDEKKYLAKRLKVIEGQIKGIYNMVEENRYCDEILIQISAVNHSLKGVAKEILKSHLSSCAVQDIQNGNLEILDKAMNFMEKI